MFVIVMHVRIVDFQLTRRSLTNPQSVLYLFRIVEVRLRLNVNLFIMCFHDFDFQQTRGPIAMASLPTQVVVFIQLLMLLIASICVMQINGSGDVGEELDGGETGRGLASEQREFDYFKLALQWPGTICRGKHRCCSSNGCCQGYI